MKNSTHSAKQQGQTILQADYNKTTTELKNKHLNKNSMFPKAVRKESKN